MAIKEDYVACENAWYIWSNLVSNCKQITCCSLFDEQVAPLHKLFPGAKITETDIDTWNLNYPSGVISDIVVVCNVFQASKTPSLWFNNILANCRYLWLQDLCMRQRGSDGAELGTKDPDSMRYTLGVKKLPNFEHPFDLNQFGDRLLDFMLYDAGSMKNRRLTINFVACLKGDLA